MKDCSPVKTCAFTFRSMPDRPYSDPIPSARTAIAQNQLVSRSRLGSVPSEHLASPTHRSQHSRQNVCDHHDHRHRLRRQGARSTRLRASDRGRRPARFITKVFFRDCLPRIPPSDPAFRPPTARAIGDLERTLTEPRASPLPNRLAASAASRATSSAPPPPSSARATA